MVDTISFKRLILRAVLIHVSPMIVRLILISDHMQLLATSFVHGQEFNSFRRQTRSKAVHACKLHRQEKFLYVCDTPHMCEWDVHVLDIQDGIEGDHVPVCLGGRAAMSPEFCGGPTGYRLMLKRQREGAAMSDPVLMEAGIQMLAEACPDQPPGTWNLLRTALDEGSQSIDRRLKALGPLQPDHGRPVQCRRC